MPTVSFGTGYFKKEVRNYSDWPTAFWRELIQNSIDAHASRIHIWLSTGEDGKLVVVFSDNGQGMSKETLENVFFCLGETTKNGADTIGGFGKARILLCFAHDSYNIRTKFWLAKGQGGQYEIEACDKHQNGCEFKISIDLDGLGVTREVVCDALTNYLSLCQIDCEIVIHDAAKDGMAFSAGQTWKNWTYRRQIVREFDFGKIHVNKSAKEHQHKLLVRVNGVLMYERWIRPEALVILEIDPTVARDVLLSNRESLHYKYEQMVESFCQEIAMNSQSALRVRKTEEDILAGGHHAFLSRAERERQKALSLEQAAKQCAELALLREAVGVPSIESDNDEEAESIEDADFEEVDSIEEPLTTESRRPIAAGHIGETRINVSHLGRATDASDQAAIYAQVGDAVGVSSQGSEWIALSQDSGYLQEGYVHPKPARVIRLDRLTEGMVFVNRANDPHIYKAAQLFHPRNWGDGQGSRRRKLLAQWVLACEAALESYCEYVGKSQIDWRWGFIFDDGGSNNYEAAEYQNLSDGSHALLINPIITAQGEGIGRMSFGLRSLESHVKLLSLACHEVAHIHYDWHSDQHTSLYGELIHRTMPKIAALHKAMIQLDKE